MQAKLLLPIEKLFSRIYHYFHHKNIIILIGKYGISVCCYRRNSLVKFQFFSNQNSTKIDQIKEILFKFKNYHVSFLLDMPEISLRLELLPQIQALMKNNPASRYIHEHYKNDDIVAYNITEIEKNKNTEIWHLQVASCQYTRSIINIVEYIISKSLKFNGFYFMPLEVGNIIKHLDSNQAGPKNVAKKIRLLLFSNQTSQCRLFALYQNEIVGQRQFAYPAEKNDSYINGLLEQHVEELLNSLKDLRQEFKLACELHVICRDNKDKVFKEIDVNNCTVKTHCHKPQNKIDTNDLKHSDHFIAYLFNQVKHNQGAKHNLSMITMLNYIGSFLSIPFVVMMVTMASFISYTKYKTYIITNETKIINKNYMELGKKYRHLKDSFPVYDNQNISNFILAKNILTRSTIQGEDDIIKLKALKNSNNILLNKASWQIKANNCFYVGYCLNENIEILLSYDSFNFNAKNISIDKDLKYIESQLSSLYPDFKINFWQPKQEQKISDYKLLIPLKINLILEDIHHAK